MEETSTTLRKRGGTPESIETKDDEIPEESMPASEDVVNDIIANLKVARYTVNAAIDYANSKQERENPDVRQAYAKIAGREWSFFADSTEISIGRVEKPLQGVSNGAVATAAVDPAEPNAQFAVDIDLGPDRQISRVHAMIEFDLNLQTWFIFVNGRNGLKLDDRHLKRGEKCSLHSGMVIGILGTQMIFITPGSTPRIHPMIQSQLFADPDDEGSEEHKDPNWRQPDGKGLPGQGAFQMDPFPSSSQGRHPKSQTNNRSGNTPTHNASALPGTPMPSRTREVHVKSGPSPGGNFSRGLCMETTEDIDYCADSARDLKPPHSYAQLIGQAILSSPDEMLTLANIYAFIKDNYAFYRHGGGGWQVRHSPSEILVWMGLTKTSRILFGTICHCPRHLKKLPVAQTSPARG